MAKPRQSYDVRSSMFAKACDIGFEILSEAKIPEEEKQRELKIILSDKKAALNPPLEYKKISSLKCIEAEHFWYWNNNSGLHIRRYWKAITQAGLPYKEKDVIASVLQRNRVKDLHEFNYLKDELFVAEQTERINSTEAKIIKEAMRKFELKHQTLE